MEGNTAQAVPVQLPSSATYDNSRLVFTFNDGSKKVWVATPEALYNYMCNPFLESITWGNVGDICQTQQ